MDRDHSETLNSPSCERYGHEMASRPALQSATKTAGKKDGGQALELLTITLKTDLVQVQLFPL